MTPTGLSERLQSALGSDYRIERELGGGGMSRVFEAEETAFGRKVVIKVLPPELAAAVNIDRFQREIQLVGHLQHPNIVPLYVAGIADGLPYFTMPLITGETLRNRLVRSGELPVNEAVKILSDILTALSYAHEQGVVHRDIKPENVLLTKHRALVADFGVAKAISLSTQGKDSTSTGVALGTPAYMAPEQAAADPSVDHRADLYSVGAVAYEMLTGYKLFGDRTPQQLLAAHAVETPDPIQKKRPAVPLQLAELVMSALEKHPADRVQSAEEMLGILDTVPHLSATSSPKAQPELRARTSRATFRRRPIAIAAVAALLVAVIVYQQRGRFHLFGSGSTGASDVGMNGSADPVEPVQSRSIAVLPFTNMSGDPASDYFSDGLTEELLNVLAQIPGLRVAARTSSFQFKGKPTDIREVGRRLSVAHVLEGSVRKGGQKMRITAQLIDARSGYHIWSEAYDRNVTDVFAVQDEITNAIGKALRLRLAGSAVTHMVQNRPENGDAHELYLRGLFSSNLRTQRGMENAIRYFQGAVAEDSTYALAYAGLARAYLNLAAYGYMPEANGMALAKPAINRALELDPTLDQGYVLRCMVLEAQGDRGGAESEVRKAIELYPNYSDAHVVYASLLTRSGRVAEGLREIRIAQKLDPIALSTTLALAVHLEFAHDYKRSISEFYNALSLSPENSTTYAFLANTLALDGQVEEAIKAGKKAVALSPDDPLMALSLAFVYAKVGQRQRALELVRPEEKKSSAKEFSYEIASVYAALGDKDRAFQWLERLPSVLGIFIKVEPALDPLRDDPRFDRILRKWGLN